MKKTQPNPTEPRRILRRVAVFSLFILLSLGSMLNYSGCLPVPTMLQVANILPCGSSDINKPVGAGFFDLSLSGYLMTIGLQNMLAQTGNTALLKPETNYIEIKEIKVWFEYPAQFSLLGAGAELYTKANPKITKVYFRLAPKTTVNFSGGGTVGGSTVVEADIISFSLVPVETLAKWGTASELKAAQLGNKFTVIAHITISGATLTGSIMQTQELTFPLTPCRGCLDLRQGKILLCNKTFQLGDQGSGCVGQDGICLKPKEKGAP